MLFSPYPPAAWLSARIAYSQITRHNHNMIYLRGKKDHCVGMGEFAGGWFDSLNVSSRSDYLVLIATHLDCTYVPPKSNKRTSQNTTPPGMRRDHNDLPRCH